MLADPLRFIGAEPLHERVAACDPRLSERGNRLRRLLLSWDGISSQVARTLSRDVPVGLPVEEARVLGPLVHRALGSARRASEPLEAIARASGLSYG